MYGETIYGVRPDQVQVGLSPHVRGNPTSGPTSVVTSGSIPACTGKPRGRRGNRLIYRVYPRMYGETAQSMAAAGATTGLSPHVRGNLCVKMTHS